MKHGFSKLRYKILIYILPISISSMMIIAIFGANYAKMVLLEDYESDKDNFSNNVVSTVNRIDSGYLMLEQSIEENMEKVILDYRTLFEEAGGNPDTISLEEIKKKIDDRYDYMIIDETTTIIKSTTNAALQFNFMDFNSSLGQIINQIRLSDQIEHERIRTNVGTGYLSKFTYLSTSDHAYLLEIAYSKSGLQELIADMDPLTEITELQQMNDFVDSIRVYDAYGYQFVDRGENYEPTETSLNIVAKAKQESEYEIQDGIYDKRYIYIDCKHPEYKMSDNSKVVEIIYNRAGVTDIINKLYAIMYSVSLVLVLGIILIIVVISKRITQPVTILLGAAKRVAMGDYNVQTMQMTKDELGELSGAFNAMVGEIKGSFEKIEKQRFELEEYSRNLENMVYVRTTELNRALELSQNTQKLLAESNIQFENLFQNIQDVFAVNEMICDDEGKPVDYRLISANPAFMKTFAVPDMYDKTLKEINPQISQEWIDLCGRVAFTGIPCYCEKYYPDLDRHFAIHIFSHKRGQFAILASDITSFVVAKEEIKKEKYILERILEDTLSGYWDWNIKDDTEYLSPAFKKMLGYEDNELINSPDTKRGLLYPEDRPYLLEVMHQHFDSKGQIPFYVEVRYYHKDGSLIWVINSGHVVEWDGDRPVQMIGSTININHMKQLEKSLKEERELLKATLFSISDGVISTDNEGMITMMNSVAENLTGWTRKEALGRHFDEVYIIISEYTQEICEGPVAQVIREGRGVELADHILLVSKNGESKPIENSAAPIRDDQGNTTGAVVSFRDFTERKEKQARIEYLSYHDQLTGIYNRRYWEEMVDKLDQGEYYPYALVLIDVNGLKMINDAFGHIIGDKVLQRVAEILSIVCRKDDTVSRIGGDEFVMMLPNSDQAEAEKVLPKLLQAFEKQRVGNVYISISYGLGVKRSGEEKLSDVFKVAEDSMYRHKLSESRSMRYKMIDIIIQTLYEKSIQEKEHSEYVSLMCEKIGIAAGMDANSVKELKAAGLMHDIGKIAIDLSILDKPSALSSAERIEIERHPELGYQILRSINEFAKMAEYVLAHHESWDGNGYPGKLKGDMIPLEARIIKVADAYHAMISDRPYRRALTKEEAISELKKYSGIQFDPEIVRIILELIEDHGEGAQSTDSTT